MTQRTICWILAAGIWVFAIIMMVRAVNKKGLATLWLFLATLIFIIILIPVMREELEKSKQLRNQYKEVNQNGIQEKE